MAIEPQVLQIIDGTATVVTPGNQDAPNEVGQFDGYHTSASVQKTHWTVKASFFAASKFALKPKAWYNSATAYGTSCNYAMNHYHPAYKAETSADISEVEHPANTTFPTITPGSGQTLTAWAVYNHGYDDFTPRGNPVGRMFRLVNGATLEATLDIYTIQEGTNNPATDGLLFVEIKDVFGTSVDERFAPFDTTNPTNFYRLVESYTFTATPG